MRSRREGASGGEVEDELGKLEGIEEEVAKSDSSSRSRGTELRHSHIYSSKGHLLFAQEANKKERVRKKSVRACRCIGLERCNQINSISEQRK